MEGKEERKLEARKWVLCNPQHIHKSSIDILQAVYNTVAERTQTNAWKWIKIFNPIF